MERKSSPEEIWKAEMLRHFSHEEIHEAKSLLWEVSREEKLGQLTRRIGDSKSKSEIEDICKGLSALAEKEVMPLFVATENMIARNPICKNKQTNSNFVTIEKQIKSLAESLNTFEKNQVDIVSKNHQRVLSKIDLGDKKSTKSKKTSQIWSIRNF